MQFHLPTAALLTFLCGAVSLGASAPATGSVHAIAPSSNSRLAAKTYGGLEGHVLEDGPALGATLVKPLLQGEQTWLLAQAYGFEGEAETAGLGAGLILRYRFAGSQMLEFNTFLDGLRDRDGYSYPQIGSGLAYTRSWVVLRANGYLPLRGGDDHPAGHRNWSERTGSTARGFTETNWSQDRWEHHSAMHGFDAEAEFRLPNPPRWVDPHLAVGYFYRAADDRSAVYSGLVLRGELHFGENWSAEAEWRDDAGDLGQEFRFVLRYQRFFGGSATPERGAVVSETSWMDRQISMPVERRAWPTVSRTTSDSSPERGKSRRLSQRHTAPIIPPSDDDCCPSSDDPLIFD